MYELLGMPPVASQFGMEVDKLTVWVHWLMAVLFVGWSAFFLFILFRFRKGRNPKANYHGVKSHSSTYLEISVALAEAVLLFAFSIPLYTARVEAFPDKKDAVEISVVAEQFAWNIHYPGPDGIFGATDPKMINAIDNPVGIDRNDPAAKDDFTTLNQLNLPLNKPVIIHLTSKDVLHSFALQEMRVKQDAVPGTVIPLWFVPVKEGNYEISCAQLCGAGHYSMKGNVSVLSQEAFTAWVAEQSAKAQAGGGDDVFE